jgi:transposase
MAGKADFSESEWNDLHRGVTGAGLLVAEAHRDLTDSFGEASAVAKTLAAHRESDSQLVRELASDRGTGFGVLASRSEVESTLTSLRSSVALLAVKAPEELEPYRSFVLDVAHAAAEAKGGVQAEETDAIARITDALGGA